MAIGMYRHKEGIELRKLSRSDLPFVEDLKRESWWGTHKTLIGNTEDCQKWFDSIPSDQLFMIAYSNTLPIGLACYTNIDWISQTMSISGSITKNSRQKDIVQPAFCAGLDFAFEMLNMRRLEAEVLEYHNAAFQLETGLLGFRVEGRKKQAVYKCGKYYDSIMLGLLREEWAASNRIQTYKGCCNHSFQTIRLQLIPDSDLASTSR